MGEIGPDKAGAASYEYLQNISSVSGFLIRWLARWGLYHLGTGLAKNGAAGRTGINALAPKWPGLTNEMSGDMLQFVSLSIVGDEAAGGRSV